MKKRLKKLLNKCKAFLLDIFFPNFCPFCDELIRWDGLICEPCAGMLSNANAEICRKCGKIVCACEKEMHNYDLVYASMFFDDTNVSKAIYEFKRLGNYNIAVYTAQDAAKYMENEKIPKPDIVAAVPMGKIKKRRRGHNQAEILARCIGEVLDIPFEKNLLFKHDTKDEQHFYTSTVRRKRVDKLFYGGQTNLSGKTVVLCDDVMTTGSTLDKCAELLKEMGAEKVIVIVCAVTRLKNPQKYKIKQVAEKG